MRTVSQTCICMALSTQSLNSRRNWSIRYNISLGQPFKQSIITTRKASRTNVPTVRALFMIPRINKTFFAMKTMVQIYFLIVFSTIRVGTRIKIMIIESPVSSFGCKHHMPAPSTFESAKLLQNLIGYCYQLSDNVIRFITRFGLMDFREANNFNQMKQCIISPVLSFRQCLVFQAIMETLPAFAPKERNIQGHIPGIRQFW